MAARHHGVLLLLAGVCVLLVVTTLAAPSGGAVDPSVGNVTLANGSQELIYESISVPPNKIKCSDGETFYKGQCRKLLGYEYFIYINT